MAKPGTSYLFAAGGTKTDPGAAKRNLGYIADEQMPFDWHNWQWGNTGDWFAYMDLEIGDGYLMEHYGKTGDNTDGFHKAVHQVIDTVPVFAQFQLLHRVEDPGDATVPRYEVWYEYDSVGGNNYLWQVFNASYSGATWSCNDVAKDATAIKLENGVINTLYHAATAGTWASSGWDIKLTSNKLSTKYHKDSTQDLAGGSPVPADFHVTTGAQAWDTDGLVETSENAAGGSDFAIVAVVTGLGGSFDLAGGESDVTAKFPSGSVFTVHGSTNNDATDWLVASSTWTGAVTRIVVDAAQTVGAFGAAYGKVACWRFVAPRDVKVRLSFRQKVFNNSGVAANYQAMVYINGSYSDVLIGASYSVANGAFDILAGSTLVELSNEDQLQVMINSDQTTASGISQDTTTSPNYSNCWVSIEEV